MSHVIVLGAGLAGLSAALKLSDAGHDVTVLEARPQAGGRAFSFTDGSSCDVLDNGQHVMMGCYSATLRYIDHIGSAEMIRRFPGLSLAFRHADGGRAELRAGALPGAPGLLQGVLRFGLLSVRDRIGIVRAMVSLRLLGGESAAALHDKDCATWLTSLGQSERAMECFWTPVVLATLNATPAQASAGYLYTVLRAVFFSGSGSSDMLLPDVGLSELLVRPALKRLSGAGARVALHNPVECIELRKDRVIGVRMKNGEMLHSDAVISAVAPWSLARLLPDSPVLDNLRGSLDRFKPSPILSTHVWLRRDPGIACMTGALGTAIQWLFQKGKSADGSWRISCTISASDAMNGSSADDIRALLTHELPLLIPGLSERDILRILPLHEKRATFRPEPGIEYLRPRQRTDIPRLYLAGDWTATSLPATIEGAILSGELAAAAVHEEADD
jgi:hydroxysqualene dehydroxylase